MDKAKDNCQAIDWLLKHGCLTRWETDFLSSLPKSGRLTPKQQAKLDQIWQEVVVEKRGDDD